jgi:hypothetical protein
MRILAHGTVQKLHVAAVLFQFFQQQNLMYVVSRQPVGCGNQNQIEAALGRSIPQPIQPRPLQGSSRYSHHLEKYGLRVWGSVVLQRNAVDD